MSHPWKIPTTYRKMPNQRIDAAHRMLYRNAPHKDTYKAGMVNRVRKPTIATEHASFKVSHTAKTGQSWRYPGGKVQRHVLKRINGRDYFDPKDPSEARRKQESNFFITINTNKNMDALDLGAGTDRLQLALNKLQEPAVLAACLKFGPVDLAYKDDRFADVVNLPIEFKASVETGDMMNRLHSHIWMTITHYSQIQLNVQMIQYFAKDSFNNGGQLGGRVIPALNKDDPMFIKLKPYVHVKLLPQSDWTTVMKQYIHKGMKG